MNIQYFDMAFSIYNWMIFARILMSWFKIPDNKFFHYIWDFLYELTEPLLGLFRRLMPPAMVGAVGIDFSPIVAFFVLGFVYKTILRPLILAVISSVAI